MNDINRQFDSNFTDIAKRVVLIVLFVFAAGCSSQKYDDLDKYIEDVKQKTKGRIEPLPEVKTYESQPYSASDLRDPFTPYEEEPSEELAQPGIQPNMQRLMDEIKDGTLVPGSTQ